MRRLGLQPGNLIGDIGGVIASLLSPENGWINGQRIEVSGGIFL